jgi:putative transposase
MPRIETAAVAIRARRGGRIGAAGETGFWASVTADLRNRGVRDVLVACCDGLAGFEDAIRAAFPATVVQTCVVHYADLRVMPTSRPEWQVAA